MEVTAKLRHLQASPQKVRLVADMIRGKDVEEAAIILKHTNKRAARPLAQAAASRRSPTPRIATSTVDIDDFFVKEIFVDGGPALKRIWFTTMGRAFRKLKRQSHVTIKLETTARGRGFGQEELISGSEDPSLRFPVVVQQDLALALVRRRRLRQDAAPRPGTAGQAQESVWLTPASARSTSSAPPTACASPSTPRVRASSSAARVPRSTSCATICAR